MITVQIAILTIILITIAIIVTIILMAIKAKGYLP